MVFSLTKIAKGVAFLRGEQEGKSPDCAFEEPMQCLSEDVLQLVKNSNLGLVVGGMAYNKELKI